MLGRVEAGEQLLASEKAAWVKLLQVRLCDVLFDGALERA